MFSRRSLLFTLLSSTPIFVASQQTPAPSIASLYGLTTSTTLPFPSATQSSDDTNDILVSSWSLGKGKVQNNPNNLAFVDDPFPNNPAPVLYGENRTGPVLQTTYPANTFGSTDDGAQFINLWNTTDGSTFQTMLLTYEVAFPSDFDWVKGGKLPGLRGGWNSTGCSGGDQATGEDCFSTRLMWRTNGEGEVYAYIPSPNNLCSSSDIICNTDYGISIQRGAYGFVSGQWNRISLLVRLNDPPNVANGNVQLYYNDLKAIDQQNLQIRANTSVTANGFYFSTFFGGSDSTWETPNTTYTYYRNIILYGGNAASNLTGQTVSAGQRSASLHFSVPIILAVAGWIAVFSL